MSREAGGCFRTPCAWHVTIASCSAIETSKIVNMQASRVQCKEKHFEVDHPCGGHDQRNAAIICLDQTRRRMCSLMSGVCLRQYVSLDPRNTKRFVIFSSFSFNYLFTLTYLTLALPGYLLPSIHSAPPFFTSETLPHISEQTTGLTVYIRHLANNRTPRPSQPRPNNGYA